MYKYVFPLSSFKNESMKIYNTKKGKLLLKTQSLRKVHTHDKKILKNFGKLFLSIPDAILVEKKNGEIVYANAKAVEVFGYKSNGSLMTRRLEELYGEFIISDKRGKVVGSKEIPVFKIFKGKKTASATLNFKSRKRNVDVWLNLKSNKVGDNNTAITILSDVTEEIEEQKERELFVGFVSHEFRSPLASIKAYVQLLIKRIKEEKYEESIQFLENVDDQTDRLTNLINNWLDATRVRAGQLKLNIKAFNYEDLVTRVVGDFKIANKRNLIEVQIPKGVEVYGDPDRIAQVLTNLLSNAANFSQEKQKIIVSIKVEKGRVKTGVKDFGRGIPFENQKQIFKLFKKGGDTVRRTGGTGLGLYISAAIIKAHKGKIEVESKPGKGATFYFILPTKK